MCYYIRDEQINVLKMLDKSKEASASVFDLADVTQVVRVVSICQRHY